MKLIKSSSIGARALYTIALMPEERAKWSDTQLINLCDGPWQFKQWSEAHADVCNNFGGLVKDHGDGTYTVLVYTD